MYASSALMMASIGNHVEAIKLLCEKGADVNKTYVEKACDIF